jgi:hypothetical protein
MTLREDVLSVMRDGSRIDRYLELCDGEMYLTTRNTTERQYRVPPSLDASEEDEETSVDLLLDDAMLILSDGTISTPAPEWGNHRRRQMNDTVTLHGHDAITYAEAHDMTLAKASDPIEGAREGVSVDEAREIAKADAGLLSLDLPWHTVRQHIEALREEAGEAGDKDCGEDCGDALEGDHDAIRRCMAVICEALSQR